MARWTAGDLIWKSKAYIANSRLGRERSSTKTEGSVSKVDESMMPMIPLAAHVAIGRGLSIPRCMSSLSGTTLSDLTGCDQSLAPWRPDSYEIHPVLRERRETTYSYNWLSGMPPHYTPDPSKPCLEVECPLQYLQIGHNQGPYHYNGVIRTRARGAIFGLSNPPPEIWAAFFRLTANRGLGGLREDENSVIPFSYFHAGSLGDLDSTTIDFLYGDNTQNQYIEAFLEGLGLKKIAEKSLKRPFFARLLTS